MKTIVCELKDGASIMGYLHERSEEMPHMTKRPCILICPGGGYTFLSRREADPPALAFFAEGYQVFTLTSAINERAKNFQPLMDAARAMISIRQYADEWDVNQERITVMGFSAGGHLAASLGTLWNHPRLAEKLGFEPGKKSRPDGLILCYPVITGEAAHQHSGSIELITGGDESLREIFSLEKQVTENTPKSFIWHTVTDSGVPVENSMAFAKALKAHEVPFEMHLFGQGGHGLSMCTEEVGTPEPICRQWVGLCYNWLKANGLGL